MKNSPIIQRFYIKGKLVVISPLLIGSGEDEHTDMDIIRDAEGKPFIPGTSLAGVLRHFLRTYLEDVDGGEHPIIKTLFGKTEKDSTLSLLMISDAMLKENTVHQIAVRDGLKIDYCTKTVDKHRNKENETGGGTKYDYEVIEPGASFVMKMELVIRESDPLVIDQVYDALAFLLNRLERSSLHVGAKTRRGMGQIQLKETAIRKLDMKLKEDTKTWIDFDWKEWNFQPNIGINSLISNSLTFTTPPVLPSQLLLASHIHY